MNPNATHIDDPLWEEFFKEEMWAAIRRRVDAYRGSQSREHVMGYVAGFTDGRCTERGDTTTVGNVLGWIETCPLDE